MTQEEEQATPTPEALSPEELQQQLEEERQKAEGYYASWQRTAADFANFKRRTEHERTEVDKFASAMLIVHLLPVIDDLERALGNISKELAGLTWIEGVHLIYRKLQAVLENQGVAAIEAMGQPFDPNQHEAVQRVPGEEGVVIAEFQRGYILGGRVIRPSLVAVGSGEGAEEAPAEASPEEPQPPA